MENLRIRDISYPSGNTNIWNLLSLFLKKKIQSTVIFFPWTMDSDFFHKYLLKKQKCRILYYLIKKIIIFQNFGLKEIKCMFLQTMRYKTYKNFRFYFSLSLVKYQIDTVGLVILRGWGNKRLNIKG